MAGNNYFIEYTHYLYDLQDKLMRIQLRFNECLNNVRSDISKGVLLLEEGNRLLSQRMDTYYKDVDSRYRLSKEDVDFVRTYAEVDKDGQLLATFLKREYLDKKDKLSDMLESIRIYGYLDSLSSEDARISVKVAMHDHYNSQLGNVEYRMNNLYQVYGEKVRHNRGYLELEQQKKKLEKALSAIATLDTAPEEVFQRIVSQFYDVDRKYYDWFLKMEIKEEYEEGTIYTKHCDTMRNIESTSDTILTASDEVTKLNKELEDTNKDLFEALIGISTFDINGALSVQEKPKKRLFKKEEDNNKEGLLNVFIGIMSLSSINKYAVVTFGNGEPSVNLNESFDKYFNKKYGEDTLYVDPNQFVNDLRDCTIAYYKEKIGELISKINGLNVKINSNTTLMCGNIKVGMNEAMLQRNIREQYPAKRDELQISGFSFEELERIYTDLKEFIGNGFSFGTDDEELFLRKV